jgi:hypothetical protein
VPTRELDLHVLLALLRQAFDQHPRLFGLLPVSRVEEERRPVARDDHPIVEGVAEVVLELFGVEAIVQRIGDPVVAEVDLHTPVVVHQ